MTVEELLHRISAYEITEWVAYEQATGPLGIGYQSEMLAGMHELLQAIFLSLGSDEDNENRGIVQQPRPHEVFLMVRKLQEQKELEEEKAAIGDELAAFNAAMDSGIV